MSFEICSRCGLRLNEEVRPFAEWPGDAGGYFLLSRILRKLLFCFDGGSYHIALTGKLPYCFDRAFAECPGYPTASRGSDAARCTRGGTHGVRALPV